MYLPVVFHMIFLSWHSHIISERAKFQLVNMPLRLSILLGVILHMFSELIFQEPLLSSPSHFNHQDTLMAKIPSMVAKMMDDVGQSFAN